MQKALKNSITISFALHVLVILIFGLLYLQKPDKIESQQTELAMLTEVDTLAQGITEPIAEMPAEKKVAPEPEKKPTKADKKAVDQKAADQKAAKDKAASDREAALVKEKERAALAEEALKAAKAREEEAAAKKREEEERKAALAAQKEKEKKELNDLSGSIDKALDDEGDQAKQGGGGTVASNDPLSGAKWAVKPRKTVYFPDIQSKIPDKYKKKGLGFALTAKIVFDKNGLAVKVDIINSSGDPAIDSIFSTELRKVRVEPIQVNRLDEITKTFTISLK